MADITIAPGILKGTVEIPPSKSLAHRAIICASLAHGVSKITNIERSDDILATINGMEALGASIKYIDKGLIIKGSGTEGGMIPVSLNKGGKGKNIINCKESGSTLRFLLPIAALFNCPLHFIGYGKLGKRPLEPLYKIFEEQGIYYKKLSSEPLDLCVKGQLKPGIFRLPGNISSQFITGLLFALPLLEGDSKIEITTELESIGYIDLTLSLLKHFGIKIEHENYVMYYIKGNQRYSSRDYNVEGDYSQAAFFLVGNALGSKVVVEGLKKDSLQGDRKIISILEEMGVEFFKANEGILGRISTDLGGTTIDGSQCPDIVPALSAVASLSKGESRIIRAERLRIKESDRLKAIYQELSKLGAKIVETPDGLIINGVDKLSTNEKLWSHKDHRIAMMLAIIGTVCEKPITIADAECVSKSYPSFWEDFKSLGGKII